jgi:hypothetical protein
METKYLVYEKKSECCGSASVVKARVIIADLSQKSNIRLIRGCGAINENIISYKALAKRNGFTKNYNVKKVGAVGSYSPIGQAAQTIGSQVLPGNSSTVGSPIRSTIARTLTPGRPGLPSIGSPTGLITHDRSQSRCPEGYQYGGRFTDNKFSTCGQQLFITAGPLGLAIGALRKLGRLARTQLPGTDVNMLGGSGEVGSPIISRRPEIPKVSYGNPKKLKLEVDNLISKMGGVKEPVTRLVRRDGYVLEPVVPASVLRAIPDSRDMEGATYLMNATSKDVLGGEELGMLSNTGVTSLKYVLPGGSTITLEKVRPLTVGERRKLGRTVNSAAEISNATDYAARLKEVANQTGDGIRYSESLKRARSVEQALSGKLNSVRAAANEAEKPNTVTVAEETGGRLITNIDNAIESLNNGGSISNISLEIRGEALRKANAVKISKLNANMSVADVPNVGKFVITEKPAKYQYIGEALASAFQDHMGLISPETIALEVGDSRKFMKQDPASLIKGSSIDRTAKFADYSAADVARLMISDWTTDQRLRDPSSIVPINSRNGLRMSVLANSTSGLTGLSDLKIAARGKMSVEDFWNSERAKQIAEYNQTLQEIKRQQFIGIYKQLLQKARSFNATNFKNSLYRDGKLSEGEKIHLNIVLRIFQQRIDALKGSEEMIRGIINKG